MDKELRGFSDLLLWIYDSHDPDKYEHNEAIEIYLALKGIERFADSYLLERHLPTEKKVRDEFPRNKWVYLGPVLKGTVMVPVLRLKYDFGRNPPEVRFRVGLFLLHKGELKAFGFRYESPEGPGRHHYYHAQITTDIGPNDARPTWLPVKQPAIPIDTDNPIGLLVSVLVSLYGLGYLDKIRIGVKSKIVDECIRRMFCHSIPTPRSFWKVSMKDSDKAETGYETMVSKQEFRKFIQGKYTGCRIQGITKATYDSLADNRKFTFPE